METGEAQAKSTITGQGERSPQRKLPGEVGTPGGHGADELRGATGRAAGAGAADSQSSTPRRSPGLRGPPSVGGGSLGGGSPLRATPRSPHAAGLQTFGDKYMAFAAGGCGRSVWAAAGWQEGRVVGVVALCLCGGTQKCSRLGHVGQRCCHCACGPLSTSTSGQKNCCAPDLTPFFALQALQTWLMLRLSTVAPACTPSTPRPQ